AAGLGLRLLGAAAVERAVGVHDLPAPLCHRDHVPAVAAGADSDEHARPGAAAAVRGAGPAAAQRVGVAALGGLRPPPARRPPPGPGAATVSHAVGLARTPGRNAPRLL